MKGRELKKGMVVRAPWREFGDDVNLTGVVVSVRKGTATVVWNSDGDCTSAGDESRIAPETEVEVVS